MITKLKDKYLIKKIFLLMLIIQPLLNLEILYSDKVMDLFKISPATIIRLLMVFILFAMVFISKKINKSDKALFIYSILYIIFIFLHHANSIAFTANITGEYKYSLFDEIFYLFRMFIPVLIIYITSNIELTKKDLRKVLKIIILSFSIVIIISNIFKFGIKSYGTGTILYNIFSWFGDTGLNYSDCLTIGLFIGTNRLGTLILALLPLSLYFYLTDKNNKFIIIILLQIITSIMVGTRTATYGFILVIPLMLIIYLYVSLINKKIKFSFKKIIYLIITSSLLLILVYNSPINTRIQDNDYEFAAEEENEKNNIDDKIKYFKQTFSSDFESKKVCDSCLSKDEIIAFIEENYNTFYINGEYIFRIYNYKYDYLFWIDVMNRPFSQRNNGRKIQQLISNRIFELNDNSLDKLFGVGYTRFKNSDLYLEKDFFVQYYTCGVFGVLLFVLPYIIPLLIATIYILKNIRKGISFSLMTYCFCLCILLLGGFIGGHILDEMITYTFMALFSGLIVKKCLKKKVNNCAEHSEEDLVSVIIPAYNVEEYLEECIDSVINQKDLKCKLEIIVINDGSSDGTLDICKKYELDKKIKFINNKKNKGLAYSRNVGIKRAKGNYIVFVDSDDLLYEDAISKLYNQIKLNNADMVIARLNGFDSNGEYGYYSDKYIDSYQITSIYNSNELVNCMSVCSKIYKSDIVKNNKFLEKTSHEDNSFTIEVLFSANKIVVYPEYLYYRRYREGENKSIMQKLDYKTYNDLLKNYYDILNVIEPKHNINFLLKYMIKKANNYLINHIKPEDYNRGKNEINEFINNMDINKLQKYYLKYYNKVYYLLIRCYKKIIRK